MIEIIAKNIEFNLKDNQHHNEQERKQIATETIASKTIRKKLRDVQTSSDRKDNKKAQSFQSIAITVITNKI